MRPRAKVLADRVSMAQFYLTEYREAKIVRYVPGMRTEEESMREWERRRDAWQEDYWRLVAACAANEPDRAAEEARFKDWKIAVRISRDPKRRRVR
jgi:hypothetical protein